MPKRCQRRADDGQQAEVCRRCAPPLTGRRVLALLDAVGRARQTQLVYITHHLDEMLPCITHVLHLHAGTALFAGVMFGAQASSDEQRATALDGLVGWYRSMGVSVSPAGSSSRSALSRTPCCESTASA